MTVTVHCEVDTDVSSEVIREALLDFTEQRTKLWSQLDPSTYKVHWVKETSAEVTEGSPHPRVWSREHYDWSHPTRITWTAVESNFCLPGSHVSMDLAPRPEGGTTVAVTWERTPSNLKGSMSIGVVRLGGTASSDGLHVGH
jgi:hypothetical protein